MNRIVGNLTQSEMRRFRIWVDSTVSSDFRSGPTSVKAFEPGLLDEDLLKIINRLLAEKVSGCSYYKDVNLKKIWQVKSGFNSESPDTLNVPYIPHFDRERYLKLFIYLSPVNLGDGPLMVANISTKKFEIKRWLLPNNYKERKLNFVSGVNQFKPCLGNIGSYFWLDTNQPHFGGLITEVGGFREVLRFDFEKTLWNLIPRFVMKMKVTR